MQDADLVAAERALGVPERPRFDHVGHTIDDLDAAIAYYEPYGFANTGTLHFDDDPRGFRIDYLRGGDTVIEVFTFDTATHPHHPNLATYGFVAAELRGAPIPGRQIGTLPDGRVVVRDADDLPLVARR